MLTRSPGQPIFFSIIHSAFLFTVSLKSFSEVHQHCIQVTLLLVALFLYLMNCENHVPCAMTFAKPTLAFWQDVTLRNMLGQSAEYDMYKNFARNGTKMPQWLSQTEWSPFLL